MAANHKTLDKIHLRDLRLRCIIGTNDEERQAKQDVLINITLEADLTAAGRSDRMADTVDYGATEKRVIATVEQSSCFLVEHLAERIAEVCLADARVQRVVVSVDKPGASGVARSVAVEIVRDRQAGVDPSTGR